MHFMVTGVALNFAEIAVCHESELPYCCAASAGCSLLAVMPEVNQRNEAHLLSLPHFPEEEETRRPVWILLLQGNVMEVVQSMAAAGAIRTDFFDVHAMEHPMLGKGSYAQVHIICPHSQQWGPGPENGNQKLPEIVAKAFNPCRSGQEQRAKKEAGALLAIGTHPHVVSFHGIFASKSDSRKHWMLLLGYCAGGDLYDHLTKCGVLESVLTKQLAKSMLSACAHIHSRGYMHLDVKPENVLIDTTGSFVLADCGEAVKIPVGRLCRVCGTPGYIAPEVLSQSPYNELADLFSLGAMMHLCICGRQLFPGWSSSDVLKSNAEGKVDLNEYAAEYLSSAGLEFLWKLLAKEPSKRSSAQDALGHRWFDEANQEKAVQATSDDDSFSNSCCDSSFSSLPHVHRNRYSPISSLISFLQRPWSAGASARTKIGRTPTKEYDFQGHGSAVGFSAREGGGSRRSYTTRFSKVVTWMRGRRKQQDCAPETRLAEKLTSVVCHWQ